MTLARLSFAWLAGLALAAAVGRESALVGVAVAYGLAAVALGSKHLRLAEAVVLPGLVLVGVLAFVETRPSLPEDSVATFAGLDSATVQGVVVEPPEVRANGIRLHVAADTAAGGEFSERPVSGDLLVYTSVLGDYQAGDRVEMEGQVRLPPSGGEFDYRGYLLRRGVVAQMFFPRIERLAVDQLSPPSAFLSDLRQHTGSAIEDAMGVIESGLARGVLVGQGAAVPKRVLQDLRETNLSHLVVVSGQNVTLAAMLVAAGLTWLLGRRRALVAGIIFAWGYSALVGFSPPVARAAAMVTLALLATVLGRPGSGATALGFAGLVMTAFDPQLVQDVSFQLSFAATAGLILLSRPIADLLLPAERRLGVAGTLVETLSVSIAAMVATLPIQAYQFGDVSTVGLPANLLVVPAFPLMVLAAVVAGATDVFSSGVAQAIAPATELPFRWFALVGRTLAQAPLATVEAGPGTLAALAVAYAAIAAGFLFAWHRVGRPAPVLPRLSVPRPPFAYAAGLPASALAAAVAWWFVFHPAAPDTRVVVLDVGAGQAVLVQDASGHTVLIDGGNDGPRLLEEMADALPSGTRAIDLAVATSTRADHLAGLLAVFEQYDVGGLLLPPGDPSTATERALRDVAAAEGSQVIVAAAGIRVGLQGGSLDVVATSDGVASGDERGLALLLAADSPRFLIPGDVPATSIATTLDAGAAVVIAGPDQFDRLVLDLANPNGIVVTGVEPLLSAVLGRRLGLLVWESASDGRISFAASPDGLSVGTGR